ncbi:MULTISPECIES: ABC transporter permease [Bradyrhizobium]|nr:MULTISPECIES: ABC transporter permease [Bradyrhizobium]MCG2629320.1 ABC transporter permease [Bradyrhizobium zhengyangense]MCG2644601.1 ABC transporter permease [Bradyrhizobium zhengyangense]MCG2670834.1 ABC transporter permease [Bradyrhizobium zhengyangense]MDN4984466.1 ABC transporter permease [Bradyrhizobium sp. WYCCWR 13022]MDN5002458.1 ABC transporter permease [Bradyrhizobium sp. WYCCWR 12677]
MARIALILVPLVAWEVCSRLGLINGFLFPAPSAILNKLWVQSGPNGNPPYAILWHVADSMLRLLSGLSLAVIIGTLLGVGLGMSQRARLVFQPIISILMPVPTLAWTPVLLLVMGIDNRTTILVVFLAAVFEMIYIVASGIEMLNVKMLWVAWSMGASRRQVFWRVIIPGIFPCLITGTRLGTGYAWRALIAAEMLAASSYGLGFMIYDASEYMNIGVIYGGVMMIAALGYLLENVLVGKIEAATIEKWGVLNER